MLFSVAITMVFLLCGGAADSVLTEFLTSLDQKFQSQRSFSYGPIEQPYFDDVTFFDVDTFVTFVRPKPQSELPLRIAVDTGGNVYRLFGFDTLQYNDLVVQASLALKAEQVHSYGEFFLDVTQLWDPFGHTHVASTESFVSENRRRMKDAESGVLGYGCDVAIPWNELEQKIQTVLGGVHLGEAIWNETDSVYGAEYVTWAETTGALRYFKLVICPDGRCYKAEDSVWSESFGYYYKYQE